MSDPFAVLWDSHAIGCAGAYADSVPCDFYGHAGAHADGAPCDFHVACCAGAYVVFCMTGHAGVYDVLCDVADVQFGGHVFPHGHGLTGCMALFGWGDYAHAYLMVSFLVASDNRWLPLHYVHLYKKTNF